MVTTPQPEERTEQPGSTTFFQGYERFAGVLDHPPRVFGHHPDHRRTKGPRQTGYYTRGVIGTSASNRSHLVAATHVYEEMYRSDRLGFPDKFHKLASQAAQEGWPTDRHGEFKRTFETEYLPKITFVDMGDLFLNHPVAQSVGNVSDIPTAQLAVLLACDMPVVFPPTAICADRAHPHDLGTIYQATARMEMSEFSIYASAYVSTAAVQRVNVGVKRTANLC